MTICESNNTDDGSKQNINENNNKLFKDFSSNYYNTYSVLSPKFSNICDF